ncbi:MAG: YicC/YloC family endoribonuclease [bacterium]
MPVYSMTGYARSEASALGGKVSVEIKSVNHRYLELRFHLPAQVLSLEPEMTRLFRERLSRGRVEVWINLSGVELPVEVVWNRPLARQTAKALQEMKEELDLQGSPDLSLLAEQKDILSVSESPPSAAETWKELEPVLEDGLERLLEMRAREGDALAGDISSRIDLIRNRLSETEGKKDSVVENYRQRLKRKIAEILEDSEKTDQARLEQEVALLADRTDITEELVRARSHLEQMDRLLDSDGPMGRKLDFLTQELFREINTCSNKAQDAEVSRLAVDMKAELEKIREQVQNLE